ncbi:MAG TPA: winged helix-turn-helix domain-containing protein [Terriglobales bacterium]|nr:winged helix-turn-helix domain-containing protein [Terriglobales bacterium]
MDTAQKPAEEVELDLGRYELRRRGRRVKLARKPMELLIFLVGRRGQLVSRQDIATRLWRSDLFIDAEPNINNIVRKIRTALGDDSAKPRFLETVVGKGYRFVGPVRVIGARNGEAPADAPRATSRSSLAVLPLLALDNFRDDQGLGLGIADALASRLGNLQDLDVLPSSAVLHLPAEIVAADAGARLDVRFVVHGALRDEKGQARLSLQVFDCDEQRALLTRRCDLDLPRLSAVEDELARQIAAALHRPLRPAAEPRRSRYSQDPLAYAEFMHGFRLSSAGDPKSMDETVQRLTSAVTRDPAFSLAHATLSQVCATRHFEFDPISAWLEKAEFHCRRALELDPDLPEAHVAKAFLLWGPSKNFQHLEAIAELRQALALQKNLPHAYNRLGTILAHIGLLDQARDLYERGRQFHPRRAISHSIAQVYLWKRECDLARREIDAWRAESPDNKYALYFAPQVEMMSGDFRQARALLDEALDRLPNEPMTISLCGLFHAMTGKPEEAMDCVHRACASPKTFGHAHHTYYQVACVYALLGRAEAAFEWLDRSVSTGFACWPFFVQDPCLRRLQALPQFEVLVSSLQAKYPARLGLL